MSGGGCGGSSSDDWRGTGGGSVAGDDKCAIVERTVLNSPVPAIVAGLNVGDILTVELETNPRSRLVAKTVAGASAGAITSTSIVDIIECIQNGSAYVAEVLAINAGKVEIEIRLA